MVFSHHILGNNCCDLLLVTIAAAVAGYFAFPLLDTSSISFDWKTLRNDILDAFALHQHQVMDQEMLELAEQVIAACGNLSLLNSCDEICHGFMCCVGGNEETLCKKEVLYLCPAYVACEVLLNDNL